MITTQRRNNEETIPVLPNMMNHSFAVMENTKHNRIELHLRGEFPSPEKVADEIATLYQYSEEYSTLLIYINSPGGHLNTLIELMTATKKFSNVITVGGGEIASAGFILWCSGDIRVIQPYTMVMAHRESYGNSGKTDQHLSQAEHVDSIGRRIIEEICGSVLTNEEIERCKLTEVYFSDTTLIDRGACISWDQFVENDVTPVEWNMYFTKDGIQYHATDGINVMFEDENGNPRMDNIYNVIYGIEGTSTPVEIHYVSEDGESLEPLDGPHEQEIESDPSRDYYNLYPNTD